MVASVPRRTRVGPDADDETPIALGMMRKLGHRADYLGEPHTLKWFARELYLPSAVIDRGSLDGWRKKGATSAFERARDREQAGDHGLVAAEAPGPGLEG